MIRPRHPLPVDHPLRWPPFAAGVLVVGAIPAWGGALAGAPDLRAAAWTLPLVVAVVAVVFWPQRAEDPRPVPPSAEVRDEEERRRAR